MSELITPAEIDAIRLRSEQAKTILATVFTPDVTSALKASAADVPRLLEERDVLINTLTEMYDAFSHPQVNENEAKALARTKRLLEKTWEERRL